MMEGIIEELPFLISVLVAVILGFAIGYERKLRFKEVGIRTHTIVCAGSALIMVVSKYGFGDSIEADASRVAVQIVSGIVFLGAGVIMYRRDAVYGIQLHSDMDDCWNRHNKLNSDTEYVTHYANYPTDILKFSRDRNAVHPTQKPVTLLEYLIKTYTKEGEVVMDNCMGSGSAGIACKNTGRQFIGIEADDYYFQTAKERIEKGYGV